MIKEEVFDYINDELDRIEEEFGVYILYAVESGSRAWGFDHEGSDYDVRFIYMRPIEDYLTIAPIRDVIDKHDLKERDYKYPLDFVGWDITKALSLHRKSNPSLREWTKSKIKYRGDCSFFKNLPDFRNEVLMHHYTSITKGTWEKYLKNDESVNMFTVKKYLYCIRCILCWIILHEEQDFDIPINIYDLLNFFEANRNYLNTTIVIVIHNFIDFYKHECDKHYEPTQKQLSLLREFINTYLYIMKQETNYEYELEDIQIYNSRFREVLSYCARY